MLRLIEKHWNQFVAAYSDPPATKSSKKKDPHADLKKAVSNYKDSLTGAKKSKADKLVQNFKDQIKQLPQPLRQAIEEEYSGRKVEKIEDDQGHEDNEEPSTERENIQDIAWDEVEGQTDELYECFRTEVDKFGVPAQSNLVDSVNQLYGITKKIIGTVAQ
jgi:hypothetical protein